MMPPRLRRLFLCGALAALLPCIAQAAPAALPQIEERIGAQLPLQESFMDDDGQVRQLAQLLNGKPVLLVPGYYRCPNVCSSLFQGALEALVASRLPSDQYRLLAVSIDPADDAQSAASKKAAWLPVLGSGVEAHFLSGRPQSIERLLGAAGWHARYDPDSKQYLHPAGLMVVGADGRIARYFAGLRFDPRELRQALQAAQAGQGTGHSAGDSAGQSGSLAQKFWLLCGHEGFLTGRHSANALLAVRLGTLAVLLAGLYWLWRLRRRGGAA